MIPNPSWFRMLDGASGKTPLVAALAFIAGYYWGKQDRGGGRLYHHEGHSGYGKHTKQAYERHQKTHGEGHAR
jgi:hypothetical protein